MIIGGEGFEAEHFNGEVWDRKQDVPGKSLGVGRVSTLGF